MNTFRWWFSQGCCCCCYQVASVVSDFVRSHRRQPTRLLCPWDFPSKSIGVGYHCLLQVSQGSSLHFRDSIESCPCYEQSLPTVCSVQFSLVAQSCPALCDPMNCSTPGLPVHHQLPEFTQTHVHRVGDAIQPSHPLSSPSPPAPNPSQHQSLFQWVNSSHEVAKVLEFQL